MGRRTHDEQDLHNQRDPTPAIQSQAASGQTAPVTPAAQGDPHGQRRDPHGVQKRRVHHGAHENPAAQEDPHGQRRDPHGAQKRRVHHGAQENIPHAAKAEAKKPQVQQYYITIQTWIGQPKSRQQAV